jgi:hypothetical protein
MRYLYIILFLFPIHLLSSQNQTNFSLNKQFYVYGDAMTIGNNILSKYKKKSFDKYFVINDEIKMRYIDIDDNKNTFSSSQATLTLPKTTKKIVSATLYWSAIYSFERGVKKQIGDKTLYKGNDKRDATINKIKFKTPTSTYQDIEGTILVDKFKQSKDSGNSPYVCYADVTDLINKSQNQNGDYTVANIKATQGYTTGGCAAGWLLYVVFESETDKPKYISTYHGLVTIKKEILDVELKDFKTVTSGISKASLTLSALEGDRTLSKDQCLIYNKSKETFIPLETKLRSGRNFFNASITINNKRFKDRLPYSVNTLGFDIAELDLPNKNNELIPNGTTSMKLRLKTKSDKFHLFFTAFKTELDDTFYKNKKEELALGKTNTIESNTVESNTKITENLIVTKVKDHKIVNNSIADIPEIIKKSPTELSIKTTKTVEELMKLKAEKKLATAEEKEIIPIRKNIFIDNLEPGYYVISNVFSKPKLAKRWEAFLKSKSHNSKTFLNSRNQWQYISIYNNLDKNKARLNLIQLRKNKYFEGLWIQKINM